CRYRGMLEVDLEICTACLACERACPIDCIVIDAEKDKAAGGLVMKRFDIDMAKCMYCGLCSEPCPTGAIHHTPEFEGADYSLESLIRKFVKAPVLAYKPKKGGETDPEIAPILERGMRYIEEFASPEVGGALGVAWVTFSRDGLASTWRYLRLALEDDEFDGSALIETLKRLARVYRLEGVRALETATATVEDPLLRRAIGLSFECEDEDELTDALLAEARRRAAE